MASSSACHDINVAVRVMQDLSGREEPDYIDEIGSGSGREQLCLRRLRNQLQIVEQCHQGSSLA